MLVYVKVFDINIDVQDHEYSVRKIFYTINFVHFESTNHEQMLK